MYEGKVLMDTGNFESMKGERTKVQKAVQGDLTPVPPKTGMTSMGV